MYEKVSVQNYKKKYIFIEKPCDYDRKKNNTKTKTPV